MSTVATTFEIPKTITRKVRWLRWLVRGYVVLEALAAMLLVAGLIFWLGLLIDWTLEPSPTARVLMWTAAGLSIAGVAWKYLFSRLLMQLSDSNLALLVERSFPELNQSLVTILDSGRTAIAGSPQSARFLELTGMQAGRFLSQIPLSHIFKYGPLAWKSGFMLLTWSAIGLFAHQWPETFEFYLSRAQLSATLWPRQVHLVAEGFAEDRTVNVARDDNYMLQVFASTTGEHTSPEEVQIRYRLADGRRGRDTMTKIGDAAADESDSQLFTYEFKNLTSDISFDLIGGDDRIRNLKLHVVERPQLTRTAAECVFPNYLAWAPRSIPFTSRVEIPTGSQVSFQIKANKDLEQVRVYDSRSQQELPCSIDPQNHSQFTFDLGELTEDLSLLIEMLDVDQVTNKEPYRLVISAVPDEVPELTLQLRGIGTAITPQARIPLLGSIQDDYRVQSSWAEATVDTGDQQRRPLERTSTGGRELEELGAFDLTENQADSQELLTAVQPGQKLTLAIKAQDAYDLEGAPHIGSSQRFTLDVVTESDLRALLEKRELTLRQRFESLFEKMAATRDLLTRIEATPVSEAGAALTEEALEKARERDRLRLGGVLQSSTQLSFETEGVTSGFEDIVAELVNNRIDTAEITERLEEGIITPLRQIIGDHIPELQTRLEKLRNALESEGQIDDTQTSAILQADVVIAAMQGVLDRMLELESYNELVDLLRGILEEQKQLKEATQRQRRESLRRLLDDE